ncbi:MAG TPA: hypothetical protein VEO00_02400 [Actinomycetota bacterium]|nr:hypothetical protein [Actinomycetota bacterium]
MRDVLVLVLAAGLSALVVWRMTIGPNPAARRRPFRRRRVRFEETLEVTGASFAGVSATPAFAFVPTAREERPHRFRAVIGIATTIFLLAAGGAAALYLIGHFARLAIENLINS